MPKRGIMPFKGRVAETKINKPKLDLKGESWVNITEAVFLPGSGRMGAAAVPKGFRGRARIRGGKKARREKRKHQVAVGMINVRGEMAATDQAGAVFATAAERDATPFPEVVAVEEEVHMDDWMIFPKDEEDDGAAGALLGWDGKEAVSAM
jgi:hypothetical protein